ncbi:hypothetical protein WG915_02735 [Corynebacterium sp. H128]|uniref:hypothetical protein n=1 Tax=Corynebacterium sp. H128 TaxID=3133427 RepID=UPI0030B3181B
MQPHFRPATRDIVLFAIVLGMDLFGFLFSSSVAPAMVELPFSPIQQVLILCFIIAKCGLLLLRRRFPLGVMLGISLAEAAVPLYCLLMQESSIGFNGIAASAAAVSLALHSRHKTRDFTTLALFSLIVGMLRASVTPPMTQLSPTVFNVLTVLGWVVPLLIAYGVGLAIRNNRELNESLRSQAELAERNAIAEERSRIARELHDTNQCCPRVAQIQHSGCRRTLGTSFHQHLSSPFRCASNCRSALRSDIRR